MIWWPDCLSQLSLCPCSAPSLQRGTEPWPVSWLSCTLCGEGEEIFLMGQNFYSVQKGILMFSLRSDIPSTCGFEGKNHIISLSARQWNLATLCLWENFELQTHLNYSHVRSWAKNPPKPCSPPGPCKLREGTKIVLIFMHHKQTITLGNIYQIY